VTYFTFDLKLLSQSEIRIIKYKGNSLPPLCLETHKHMGTAFQGTQISTEGPLLLKTSTCQKSGTSPPCPDPKSMTSSSKIGRFAPPEQIIWQVRARLGSASHHQGLLSLISPIRHASLWHPTCGLVAPWKPNLGFFSQNCPPTRSYKDK
jgi:hypothetical protein